jgi:hypothetical protein
MLTAICGGMPAAEAIDATDPCAGGTGACGADVPTPGACAGAPGGPTGSAELMPFHAGLLAASCCGIAVVFALARGIELPAAALTDGTAGASGDA